ncbi:alpha/beta hydrolase [Sphingomonas paeninsulae]|jgi:predicted alpha/beta hydrolase family esterase|uniref:Alpha/beta hydrolase n=1 Tax=Sphingomonas paeninsulae TaxID=2319844 RepID=A0A494T9C3_SPHPE|nr:alpha/beta fold hydrolase [Sphingomonas paeninsulae]AYJ85967.1 alpha/beta hydrolase [Sphingomonas paeninsulae]
MNITSNSRPAVFTLPGLGNSGPDHWQTHWEATQPDVSRVELGMWNAPRRNPWVTKLEQSLRGTDAPVILVAHSLGCLTVAWWAALATPSWGAPVAAALLVAPPCFESDSFPVLTREFGHLPQSPLPFPTIVVASHDDPYARFADTAGMANDWGAHLVDAGTIGHINALSGLGVWREGLVLLDRLKHFVRTGDASALSTVQNDYDRAVADYGRNDPAAPFHAAEPTRL